MEARKYIEAAAADRLEALFTVTVALGLRQAEILGLQWQDVDFQNGTLTIRRQLQRIDGKLTLVETKSDESVRPLVLPAIAISALRRHQAKHEEERQAAGRSGANLG